MKKIIFIFIALFTLSVSTIAKTKQTNYAGSSKFTDNWSIGLNGGVQTNLHDWNCPNGAVLGLEFNKQLTPLFGFTAELNTGINNRRNWYAGSTHICNGFAFDQLSVFVDGRFNLMNAILGYKGTPRFFEIEALAGVGYGHGFAAASSEAYDTDALLTKTGLNFNFNVGKKKQWTVKVSPTITWNTSQTGQFNSHYGTAQLTAGVVYHFKNSNKKHHIAKFMPIVIRKVKTKTIVVEKVVDKVVEKEVVKMVEKATSWSVDFEQGSAEIKNDITEIANEIKEVNGNFIISGFTSPEGREYVNKTLGLKRAEALKKALIDAGVDENKLTIDNEYETLRTATITLNK